jgi:hypothetical protein
MVKYGRWLGGVARARVEDSWGAEVGRCEELAVVSLSDSQRSPGDNHCTDFANVGIWLDFKRHESPTLFAGVIPPEQHRSRTCVWTAEVPRSSNHKLYARVLIRS